MRVVELRISGIRLVLSETGSPGVQIGSPIAKVALLAAKKTFVLAILESHNHS